MYKHMYIQLCGGILNFSYPISNNFIAKKICARKFIYLRKQFLDLFSKYLLLNIINLKSINFIY